MKIAILTSGILPLPPVEGGAVENLIDFYLSENEQLGLHEFTVYSVTGTKALHDKRIKHTQYVYIDTSSAIGRLRRYVYGIFNKSVSYHPHVEYFLHRAVKYILHSQYDLILIENRPVYALTLSQKANTPIVLHLHNDMLSQKNDPQTMQIRSCLNGVIAVSDFVKQRLDSVGDGLKTRTVLNGIDVSRFNDALPTERQRFGFTDTDFVIVYCGRLIPEKGVAELLQALRLLDAFPDIKLLVIGSDFYGKTVESGSFFARLQELASPIKDRIIFTGFVDYNEIPSYLKLADLSVLPSMWDEPFGLTILEALASGLPVISTNSGGIPEIRSENLVLLDRDERLVSNLAHAISKQYSERGSYSCCKDMTQQLSGYDKARYAKEFLNSLSDILEQG